MSDYIPEEGIILQILHKLPIKSLVRFTCVSKSWLSLIKNPSFISNHLKHSNKNPLSLLRYCSDKLTEHYSLYYDKQRYNHYMHLYFPFKTIIYKYNLCFRIVGTVNGLICLVDNIYYNTQTIIIWNPLVKKSVTLPQPSSTCFDTAVSYGFGFDSRSNDYKLLRLASQDNVTLEAEVYSLNMNSWKRVCAPRYEVRYYDRQVVVNGVMHVLAFKGNRNKEYRNLILGFDVGDEVFREIALPPSLADEWPYYLRLLVYKESVAVLVEGSYETGVHVWVMEEYGVAESWKKVLSFDGEEGNWPNVFGFRKNGEVFLQIPNEGIVSVEPESQEVKCLGVSGFDPFVHYFVESLELLDNANAQSDQSVENHAIGDATRDATPAND